MCSLCLIQSQSDKLHMLMLSHGIVSPALFLLVGVHLPANTL